MVAAQGQGRKPSSILDEDGAALLDEIDKFLGLYVIYPNEHTRHAHTLWCAHTHLMECWESTPRIYFRSPEWGSGKTRALEVCEHIVYRGFIALNMSSAYLIRKIGASISERPTLLYDEIDTIFGPKAKEHEDIRGVINAGHRKGAITGRCVVNGNKVNLIEFPAYCAVALAGLGDLPDTIMSRSIIVSMKRRAKDEKVKPWRERIDPPKAKALGERLADWADLVRDKAQDYWPEMPKGVEDRDADCWEALLAVADLAGGHWPQTARVAAVAAVADFWQERDSQGVLLLTDLQQIFTANKSSRLKTPKLLVELAKIEESPWKSIRRDGSAIDARGLALRLKPYGIRSTEIRWDDETTSKGYHRKDFEDAWKRYVQSSATEAQSSATANGAGIKTQGVMKKLAVGSDLDG